MAARFVPPQARPAEWFPNEGGAPLMAALPAPAAER